MLPRDRGTIVQVGSTLAYRGIPLQSAYCGAKHATQGFHESLRTELLHEGSQVRVTMVQMPAVNTPQFSWVLSRLPRQAQPVPPIYQPEVAARAVVYAADHPRRREYWVGETTMATLLVNAVAPGLLDRYLARTGFDAQRTDRPKPPTSPPMSGSRPTAKTATTSVPTGCSTTGRTRTHRRSGPLSITGRWPSSGPAWSPGHGSGSAGSLMRPATAARVVVGGACVVVPGWVLAAVGAPDRDDRRFRRTAQVLGLRLVAQAGLDVAWGRRTHTLDIAVELTHAASMLPAAVIWPHHRRAALASAVIVTGIALLDVSERCQLTGLTWSRRARHRGLL